MALDRDLGVAFVRALDRPPADGWEATASTGIRGLRLLQEAGPFRAFLFTEANPRTFEVLRQNVADDPRARALLADAVGGLGSDTFDYVDVDPYGSPLRFLPAAIAAVRQGGVLAVTATDMMVLAGAQPSACRRIYGASPVRGRLGPEGALRILLATLAREARQLGRSAEPLLCYVGGHHVRAYVRLAPGAPPRQPIDVLDPGRWDGPPIAGTVPVGPLWVGPIVDPVLASRLEVPSSAAEPRSLRRFLEGLRDDARIVAPFYYEPNLLARALGLPRPPSVDRLLRALTESGYRAGRTHVRAEGIRTDAPRTGVEDAARRAAGPA
jgi:tRNA (guanine26-N2/guanine27-N2)-dimethyltransferase